MRVKYKSHNLLVVFLLPLILTTSAYGWSGKDKDECVAAVYKNSPNSPPWYPTYYCDCVGREMSTGASIDKAVAFCQVQMKNLLSALAQDCVNKIGRLEKDKPQIKACMDKGLQVVEGGVTVTDRGIVKKTANYDVRSNNFKGSQFSAADIDDYAYRVGKRNCLDPDLAEARKMGMMWHYDFYGADRVKAGSFTISAESCRRYGNSEEAAKEITRTAVQNTSTRQKQVETKKTTPKSEVRQCLDLGTNEAIARCASQAK